MLLLNVATTGGVQVVVFFAQQEWQRGQDQTLAKVLEPTYQAMWVGFLADVYTAERLSKPDGSQVRALIRSPLNLDLFDDVIVASGAPPFPGLVYLNPRGAVHRDPEMFPRQRIYEGMAQARNTGRVPAGGGYCYAIRDGEETDGYLWFRLGTMPPPLQLPTWIGPLTALCGTVLFAAFVFWAVRSSVGRPLQAVGRAAERVGAGHYDVRLPPLRGIHELQALADSFNAMAAKVAGHTGDLQRAVTEAIDKTKAQERALVVSSRLAAMGTLAAGVAHEINNPIGGMQNAVSRLLQAEGLADKQRQYLGLVQDGLQRVARTARKLLDFSPKTVQARPFPLAAAVEGARALVEHRVQQQGVTLQVDAPAGLPMVVGDQHELQQVVLNLFLNSLDALGQKGRGGTIAVRLQLDGGKLHLHVDDDGPGLDAKDLARVMDPFFTKKERPDASGLGMFISYSIVQNHGGEIALDSAPGLGFRVHIALPAAPTA